MFAWVLLFRKWVAVVLIGTYIYRVLVIDDYLYLWVLVIDGYLEFMVLILLSSGYKPSLISHQLTIIIINEPHLSLYIKRRLRYYTESPTAQDIFCPIPGLMMI